MSESPLARGSMVRRLGMVFAKYHAQDPMHEVTMEEVYQGVLALMGVSPKAFGVNPAGNCRIRTDISSCIFAMIQGGFLVRGERRAQWRVADMSLAPAPMENPRYTPPPEGYTIRHTDRTRKDKKTRKESPTSVPATLGRMDMPPVPVEVHPLEAALPSKEEAHVEQTLAKVEDFEDLDRLFEDTPNPSPDPPQKEAVIQPISPRPTNATYPWAKDPALRSLVVKQQVCFTHWSPTDKECRQCPLASACREALAVAINSLAVALIHEEAAKLPEIRGVMNAVSEATAEGGPRRVPAPANGVSSPKGVVIRSIVETQSCISGKRIPVGTECVYVAEMGVALPEEV